MKSSLLLIASALACTTGFCADPAPTERPVNVRLELQIVAIPQEIALPLATEMKDRDKVEAGYTKIQGLLAKGTATLIGWPILSTKSGQRAVCEAISEVRYATEYTPPTVTVAPNVPPDTKITPNVDAAAFESIPTAFETRNTGVTFEVEPVVSPDGKTIDVNMVPQDVRFKRFNKIVIEKSHPKSTVTVEQPQFDTMKLTTTMTLRNGERVLLGVYRVDDPPKHLELFILKAEAIPVE